MPSFPEVPRYPTRILNRIPEGAIDLTNRALASAYPQDIGELILPLSQADIWVSTDRDHISFMRKFIMKEEIHSVVREGNQRLVKRGASVPNMLRIWANATLPGKPIFYHEGDLQLLARHHSPISDREDRFIARDAMVARILVHETIHRSVCPTAPTPVSFDDPLVALALSQYRRSIELINDPKFNDIFQQNFDEALGYIKTHDLMVNLSGARIHLYALDQDGIMRVMASSGYDLEEAIVDKVAEKTYQFIIKDAGRASGFVRQTLELNIKAMVTKSRNYQLENLAPRLTEILRDLRLTNPREMLRAFVDSRLPLIHQQLYPGKPYYS